MICAATPATGRGNGLTPAVERLEGRALLSGGVPSSSAPRSAPLPPGETAVVGRSVFYNRSAFDGRSARADARDDAAVAPDKKALVPGEAPTEANYTSYTRGINGVMVDFAGLPPGATVTAADFTFSVGNNAHPDSWKPAPAPASIRVRASPDAGATARVTVVWRDRAVRNTWLQVTVAANANTALAAPDTFYFGNVIGDARDAGGPVADVVEGDVALTASGLTATAGLDNPFDFDRNGRVTPADVRAARRNLGAAVYTAAPFSSDPTAPPPPIDGQWRMIFRDEFSGDALDPVWRTAQYWDHEVTVVGKDELQAYDATGVSVGGGMLRLTARRDDTHGVPYTSGLAMTGGERELPASPRFNFRFGYVEVRAKLPPGPGLWPAVWMMPASYRDDLGELDVVEVFTETPTEAVFATHRGRRRDVHEWEGPDLSQEFHTYAMQWRSDHVAWFVDGVERARTTGRSRIAQEAMYLILNLAVGGRVQTPPGDATPFPATMEVDYVRVWQEEGIS